jgi:endonuclease YncB( thermonuclease family)
MKRNKQPWQNWGSIDLALLVIIAISMIGLLIMVVLLPFKVHASACLVIDVPPQAVLHNNDGDTFTLFTVGPGGKQSYRVQGVDTPEISRKKGVPDEPGAVEAKAFTKAWLAAGVFHLTDCGKKTLSRNEAQVERNGETLGDALRKAGHEKRK